MLRFMLARRFSEFYRSCEFKLLKEEHEDHACAMANYIHTFRRYGHLYAKLDPLGIYDKYLSHQVGNLKSLSGPPTWASPSTTP